MEPTATISEISASAISDTTTYQDNVRVVQEALFTTQLVRPATTFVDQTVFTTVLHAYVLTDMSMFLVYVKPVHLVQHIMPNLKSVCLFAAIIRSGAMELVNAFKATRWSMVNV